MRKRYLMTLLWCVACAVRAQTPGDPEKNAYCDAIETAADAERARDRGLEAFGGAGQWDSGSNLMQAEIGIRKSLSKHLQGDAAVRLAGLQCALHDARQDVERIVKYRMPFIENQVASQRLSDLADVLGIVDEELAAAQKREQAHDATMADVAILRQRHAELFEQYLSAKAGIAGADFPPLPDGDPEQSLIRANDLALQVQSARNGKETLQTWDVSVGAGMRRTLAGDASGTANGARPFVTLNFTYNLNARAYRRRLDDSVEAFATLEREQNDGLAHQVAALRKRIAATLAEQEALLQQRRRMTSEWDAQYRRLAALRSADAQRQRAQARIDLAVAAMNEHLSRYTIMLLKGDHAPNR